MAKTYNCLECGCEFTPNRTRHAVYCSYKCARNAMRTGPDIICASCNKVFYARPSRERIYCSKKCAARKLPKAPNVICQFCDKAFNVIPSRIARRKHCSRSCRRHLSRRVSLKRALRSAYVDQLRLDIIEDRKTGMTTTDIADKYGVSYNTVAGYVAGYPIYVAQRPPLDPIDIEIAGEILSWPRSRELAETISCLN